MKRRAFMLLVAIGGLGWPLMVVAQPKVPTVGVLVLGNPEPTPFLNVLRQGFRELGYVEGETIRIEIRSAGEKAELLPERARDRTKEGEASRHLRDAGR